MAGKLEDDKKADRVIGWDQRNLMLNMSQTTKLAKSEGGALIALLHMFEMRYEDTQGVYKKNI